MSMGKEPPAVQKMIGDFAPKLVELTDRVLSGARGLAFGLILQVHPPSRVWRVGGFSHFAEDLALSESVRSEPIPLCMSSKNRAAPLGMGGVSPKPRPFETKL
jgi:hypothetical protein